MHKGVDAVKVYGWQRGKTRAPIQGLDIDRGLSVLGYAQANAGLFYSRYRP